MKISNGTGTRAEIPGHAALLHQSQMIVTALTETGDYNKPHAASCKRERAEMKIIFSRRKENSIESFNIETKPLSFPAQTFPFWNGNDDSG